MPQKHEVIKQLIFEHVEQWMAAGKFVLPDAHDCLEFVATEASEALQAKMRLNPSYQRNTPKGANERDIAIELFDTMMMCAIYERITGKPLENSKASLGATNFETLHRIVHMSAKALVVFDHRAINYEHEVRFLLGRVFFMCLALIEKLGFSPIEIAREKMAIMDGKRR